MFVAGIDAHATYSVIAIVSNTGQLVAGPIRIKNTQEDRLNDLLQQYHALLGRDKDSSSLGTETPSGAGSPQSKQLGVALSGGLSTGGARKSPP